MNVLYEPRLYLHSNLYGHIIQHSKSKPQIDMPIGFLLSHYLGHRNGCLLEGSFGN